MTGPAMLGVFLAGFRPASRLARRGAAWADRHEPGWAEHVDPCMVDIYSMSCCVLGQLGHRRYGADNGYTTLIVKHHLTRDHAAQLGFYLPPGVSLVRLNEAWAREIRARRAGRLPDGDAAQVRRVLAGAGML